MATTITGDQIPRVGPYLPPSTANQRAMKQTFKSVADLAKHLPTGTVLAFQFLSPIFTNAGECDPVYRTLTILLLVLCSLSCFVLCFTDSFVDGDGTVQYVFATCGGLWVIDGSPPPEESVAVTYRIKFIDFLHAFMSVAVFGAVALLDQNVVSCLYPTPSTYVGEIVKTVPIGIGVVAGMMFVTFPTTRHGIGFPVSNK